jgi:hypothetical protein
MYSTRQERKDIFEKLMAMSREDLERLDDIVSTVANHIPAKIAEIKRIKSKRRLRNERLRKETLQSLSTITAEVKDAGLVPHFFHHYTEFELDGNPHKIMVATTCLLTQKKDPLEVIAKGISFVSPYDHPWKPEGRNKSLSRAWKACQHKTNGLPVTRHEPKMAVHLINMSVADGILAFKTVLPKEWEFKGFYKPDRDCLLEREMHRLININQRLKEKGLVA